MGTASGLQTLGLIGIETSPKMKQDLFAVFEKRSQDQTQIKAVQDELAKKDQVIHCLFGKLEKLSDKKTSFGQLYSSISRKVERYQ
jgi:hypothetical protein